jgi:hypothetical protein
MCLRDIMVMAEGSVELLTFEARKYARAIVRDFSDDTFGAELEDGVEFRKVRPHSSNIRLDGAVITLKYPVYWYVGLVRVTFAVLTCSEAADEALISDPSCVEHKRACTQSSYRHAAHVSARKRPQHTSCRLTMIRSFRSGY